MSKNLSLAEQILELRNQSKMYLEAFKATGDESFELAAHQYEMDAVRLEVELHELEESNQFEEKKMTQTIKREIVVVNDNMKVLRKMDVDVSAEAMAKFDAINEVTNMSLVQHTAAVVQDSFFNEYIDVTQEHAFFANMNVIPAITGGSIADVIMNKEIKDIDVLYVTTETGYKTFDGVDYFFKYEGIHDILTRYFGFLSMPHCYSRINGAFQVYQSHNNQVDFLFRELKEVEAVSPYHILTTLLDEYDQDIKLGFYYDKTFYVHESMMNAIENGAVGFNKRFLANLEAKGDVVSEKEIARLEKARKKYTPDIYYVESILSEYSIKDTKDSVLVSILGEFKKIEHDTLCPVCNISTEYDVHEGCEALLSSTDEDDLPF